MDVWDVWRGQFAGGGWYRCRDACVGLQVGAILIVLRACRRHAWLLLSAHISTASSRQASALIVMIAWMHLFTLQECGCASYCMFICKHLLKPPGMIVELLPVVAASKQYL
jgi:hypothetical protein